MMTLIQEFQTVFTAGTLYGATSFGHAIPDFVGAVPISVVNPIQIGLLVGGIVILLLVAARHQRARTAAGRSISRSDNRRIRSPGDETLREVEAVMAQLDQLSRQIHGKIDLKLATLQKLIRDADQRIEQLSCSPHSVRSEASFDVELESETPDRPIENDQGNPHDAVYRLADSGYTPLQIAKELARHTGEVELILSLRRTRQPQNLDLSSVRKQAS